MPPFVPLRRRLVVTLLTVVAATGACSGPSPTDARADDSDPRRSIVVVTMDADDDPFVRSAVTGARTTARSLDASLDIVRSGPDRLAVDVQTALAARPTVVVGIGAATLDVIDPAAASNLDQQFVVVGGEAAEPTENLTTAVFREHEALYLTGVEAGATSRSGTVGAVAPAANPLVDAWVGTFEDGVATTRARVDVTRMAGDDTGAAATGLDAEVDVVQSVLLGASGVEGTAERPAFAIGPDGCRTPNTLDSVVTHADLALDATVREVVAGRAGGVHSFGLAEEAITLASLEGDDDCLVTTDTAAMSAVRDAFTAIVDGTTVVPDPDFVG